ncbi:metallo-beta-lactamase superfamily protein [Antricoccus suffuscus]|uniref:Metallo-beta-lactamase superfamily protein n=1 Tax=Antricoccus suffuscus TaxID=1629062 RepID=A0A2T1A5U8_9ACTN|nr:alkyl sulfatase dimerization domain-containing protein [Antricoccus suffuscus]PRZ43971.1 metallo-beta-lactamase superfamily protein [Antricoccus suffuscus]
MDILEYADKVWRQESDAMAYHNGDLREHGLHAITDGVHMWPAFGNVYVFETDDGLLMFDAGSADTARALFDATRKLSAEPLRHAVYSHGHVDHIWGTKGFDQEADANGWNRPTVVAHSAVKDRFDRYISTNGYNTVINQRQFQAPDLRWPKTYRYPDTTYDTRMTLSQGGLVAELSHGYGETDDATVAWFPQKKVVCVGDFFIWSSPNAGNPQKVQRYALKWAEKLREIAGLGAGFLLPGHGLPIVGKDRIVEAMTTSAEYLEHLHASTMELLNSGATLDTALHSVDVPEKFLDKPYLRPSYDEPEFVVRNAWRLYGGWYDGDPSNLKPARRSVLGESIATLAGGADALAATARRELNDGDERVAAKLIQLATDAEPDNLDVHAIRAEIFGELRKRATSTMSKGVYAWAVAESTAKIQGRDTLDLIRENSEGKFRLM